MAISPLHALPTRTLIAESESLDSFLERLAAANDLPPSELLRLITVSDGLLKPTLSFLMFKPDPAVVNRIAWLSGVETSAIRKATLLRFGDGLPYHLGGLDPLRRHSFRLVVTQGWFPLFGSQVCPQCVAECGYWRIDWRLPLVAVCVRHRVYLSTRCAGCNARFRTHRRAVLRPLLDVAHPCGNPVGLRDTCRHSVLAHTSETAPPAAVEAAESIDKAIHREALNLAGERSDPRQYLSEIRHVATLLLHLLSRPGGAAYRGWAGELAVEAAVRTTSLRGPRWGISAPRSARVRGNVLAAAHEILSQSSIHGAGSRLAPWLELIADESNGPSSWMVNRTTRTPFMEQLIEAAVGDRHHVGRRLDKVANGDVLRPAAIPQLIDTDIYCRFFTGMLGSHEMTGRLYVSLCILRIVASVNNWCEAAGRLSLEADIGRRTARAASARLTVSPAAFAEAVEQAKRALPPARDFRRRELRVRALAQNPSQWFDSWRTSTSPARRRSSLGFAITWLWCEAAQGFLDSSPAWATLPTSQAKARYRAFRNSMPQSAQRDLRALVLTRSED
ncbi:TniQ family protein [Mycobacterium sp. AT1]|uniref:TniQ family protein n=1 Tax=Mycobacterium sp. AT1 TaxID=1961706 RepID=UPI0009AD6A9B|nr:TniQ family protein [Mycobacterium sp. AT1]OPX11782.1 hypothetical protein B1790_06345 [Mycobacterium sp. AT1]